MVMNLTARNTEPASQPVCAAAAQPAASTSIRTYVKYVRNLLQRAEVIEQAARVRAMLAVEFFYLGLQTIKTMVRRALRQLVRNEVRLAKQEKRKARIKHLSTEDVMSLAHEMLRKVALSSNLRSLPTEDIHHSDDYYAPQNRTAYLVCA